MVGQSVFVVAMLGAVFLQPDVTREVEAKTTSTTTTTTTAPTPLTVEERCQQDREVVFAHQGFCQLYYNCSSNNDNTPHRFLSRFMEECPFPQLFSEVTSRCEDFDDVNCGSRVELVDRCDYLRSLCRSGHCVPCRVWSPSCKGLPDGMNVFLGKEWTPYYAMCRTNRTVSTGVCPYDRRLSIGRIIQPVRGTVNASSQWAPALPASENQSAEGGYERWPDYPVFSPESKRCIDLYQVPRQHGGLQPHCRYKADGLHPDDVTFRPNLYFRCPGGQCVGVGLCPPGSVFDQNSKCQFP